MYSIVNNLQLLGDAFALGSLFCPLFNTLEGYHSGSSVINCERLYWFSSLISLPSSPLINAKTSNQILVESSALSNDFSQFKTRFPISPLSSLRLELMFTQEMAALYIVLAGKHSRPTLQIPLLTFASPDYPDQSPPSFKAYLYPSTFQNLDPSLSSLK